MNSLQRSWFLSFLTALILSIYIYMYISIYFVLLCSTWLLWIGVTVLVIVPQSAAVSHLLVVAAIASHHPITVGVKSLHLPMGMLWDTRGVFFSFFIFFILLSCYHPLLAHICKIQNGDWWCHHIDSLVHWPGELHSLGAWWASLASCIEKNIGESSTLTCTHVD